MTKPVRLPSVKPMTLGHYTLTATGVTIRGNPTFEEHEEVGKWIQNAHKASGFWLADWLRYGASRADWQDRIDQAVDITGMNEKTLKNMRSVGRIEPSRRRDDVEFGCHEAVASLPPTEQTEWLEKVATHGWSVRELRMELRASRRRKIIEGQAVLSGVYRVIYADPPWIYGDRPPSGSGAQTHYPGMTIDQLCRLPVASHCYDNAVLFMWVTAPLILQNPGPREVIEAWGFTYKTNSTWDKVLSAGGHYFAMKHEHLAVCTRGSCQPDRPVPQPDSVQTIRRDATFEHSEKPEEYRKIIEQMYDGPYLELFGREPHAGWDVFGNDAALWHEEKAALVGATP